MIEPLTGYIWLGAHPLHDSRLVHVASLFQSLAAGLRTLDEFYRTIPVVRPSSPLAGRLFPHVSSYVDTEGEVRFRYLSKLEGHSPEKAVFKRRGKEITYLSWSSSHIGITQTLIGSLLIRGLLLVCSMLGTLSDRFLGQVACSAPLKWS